MPGEQHDGRQSHSGRTDWASRCDLDCVVICGGPGTRLMPRTWTRQKSMIRVAGHPLLDYIVGYWRRWCSRFVFVAHAHAEQIDRFRATLDVDTAMIVEDEPQGIARALGRAARHTGDQFVTVLGDCLCCGEFQFPAAMSQGIGVTEASDARAIRDGYSVQCDGDRVTEVIEKPERIVNRLCGMGTYFFSSVVFDHIDATPCSTRTGRVEITDVIQHMIGRGLRVAPVPFVGDYVNVTYPRDLSMARRIARRLGERFSERSPATGAIVP